MSFRERGEDFVFKERVYTTVKDLVFRVEDAHKKIRGSEVKRFRFYIIILKLKLEVIISHSTRFTIRVFFHPM
jgi:hypothetical protein